MSGTMTNGTPGGTRGAPGGTHGALGETHGALVAAAEPEQLRQRLLELAARALDEARRQGASAAEVSLVQDQGYDVNVRLGEVETVEYTSGQGLDVRVYFGRRTGAAGTSDASAAALRDTVRAACAIARHTAEDPHLGLADPECLATHFPDLDLYHPWPLTTEAAIDKALACETAARDFDRRIVNSEGASLGTHWEVDVYANSNGFAASEFASRHSMGCSVIASKGDGMQRDYWYSQGRHPEQLRNPADIGRTAAQRALARLGGRPLATTRVPVVYEAPVARSLLGHLAAAARGASLYRKSSFLLDALGQRLFPDGVRIHEQPHLPRAIGSAAWDSEGVATSVRELVAGGVLQGYLLDSYSARKLGMQTTGNAGGSHNLEIDGGAHDLDGLLKTMHKGLLVTELIGSGVNTVTGDYSRGAAGFLVEDGAVQHAVNEITIAGNLRDMFRNVVAVGNDTDTRANIRTGSILIGEMTVAGSGNGT